MSDQKSSTIQFLLPEGSANRGSEHHTLGKVLPKVLGGTTRSTDNSRDPFINERVINVESVFDVSGAARGNEDEVTQKDITDTRLLTLEATDGTTIIIRADKLKEDLERLYPDKAKKRSADDSTDQIDLSVLQDEEAAARGIGNWIWSTLSVLNIKPDGLVEAAKDKALELLKDKLGEEFEDLAHAGASWAGAKALMWAIESKLEGEPGLYHWGGPHTQILERNRVDVEHPELNKAAEEDLPILVFIHGTASSTVGSFGKLREGTDEGNWDSLTQGFAGHVYGFEHRTFSESPLENAILLAKSLPKNTKLSLITHSRGGLVGDLLCIADFTDDMISRFQRKPVLEEDGENKGKESEENKKLREAISLEECNQLRELRDILKEKNFRIERYMRVACPASGTTLLADNLDLFLSSMLSLLNFTVGLIPAVGSVGGATLSAFRRIVLEIAEKRIDPRLIPGIEAMLPSSPMAVLLAQAKRREGIDMAVIAGDADGDSGGFLKRIAVMMTDWIMFDHFDNDFVVDTQSMRAGLARRNPTREYYAKGHQVNHIRYFARPDTRRALCKWMTDENPQELPTFSPIPTDYELKKDEPLDGSLKVDRSDHKLPDDAPIIFYLPGIMGSHLEIAKDEQSKGDGDRVWFDPFDLAAGGIGQIVMDKKNVRAEGLFERYYGDLANYLSRDHEVISFAYDWRRSIVALSGEGSEGDERGIADDLADLVEKKLKEIEEQPQRQVCFLAHSMGGLVVRALIAQRPGLWDKIVKLHDGQFVMLGTPNNGAHSMVENLMGKGDSVRKLAVLDFQHDLQEVISIIGTFKGSLQLLPRKDFIDTGLKSIETGHIAKYDYQQVKTWDSIRKCNTDKWFGYNENILGIDPDPKDLAAVEALWKVLDGQHQIKGLNHPKKISYVFGLDGHTPCGITEKNNRLYMHGTVRGDGSVTWDSGRLKSLPDERYWYMPVPHSNLTNSTEYFAGITDLLRKGKTTQLSTEPPRTRSSSVESYHYDAGPVLQPGAEDIALSFFGGRPHRNPTPDTTQVLKVSVKASDLRFVQRPLICGHYISDSIAGAEHHIDQNLVNGALRQRERLGIYAGEIGTNTIVLNPRTAEDIQRGSGRGAIIVGLGDWNTITADNLTKTIRNGVLQYLLHTSECQSGPEQISSAEEDEGVTDLKICSLLIGYNSTTHITVSASIEAIVRGVCAANQQYRYQKSKQQPDRAIGELEFIEFYRDTAITAAYNVRDLPHRLEKELQQLEARIVPESELLFNKGMRERLSERSSGSGYWSRLMVTDADQQQSDCPAECYENKLVSPIPQQVMDAVKKQMGLSKDDSELDQLEQGTRPTVVAERLKYVYLSERARAEAINQQRQPGLIEALIKDAISDSRYNEEVSRTLFQLMMPVDFKSTMRRTEKMLLVLDGYTANLPWEMLQADGEPLAKKMAIVRQLVSTRFRKNVIPSTDQNACVIGNPSTAEFHHKFVTKKTPETGDDGSLTSLRGAVSEAKEVTETLKKYDYQVETLYPDNPTDDPHHKALDVFNALFKKPYRILMIAAHGEVNVRSKSDGKMRTGVVLSDGVMLTAAEISQMEVVPDLVFLNCCHLGKTDGSSSASYNRLAYSVARELIEMGVRCVIAAGWAVDDTAACTFSNEFFKQFVGKCQTFGDAVFSARKLTYKMHPLLNTWGAYQAYGDPNYALKASADANYDESWMPVAPQELISELESIGVNLEHKSETGKVYTFEELSKNIDSRLAKVPQEWIDRPSTQYLLATLYGNILPKGFQKARQAFQRAIHEYDPEKRVPIEAVQNLGNLEAKQAEALSSEAEKLGLEIKQEENADTKKRLTALKDQNNADALRLIDQSICRLEGLLDVTKEVHKLAGDTDSTAGNCTINTERNALLGSAYKRKAVIFMRNQRKRTSQIKALLEQSNENYRKAEGVSFDYNFDPYAMINHLQLSGLLGETVKNHSQLIEKAKEASRRLFKKKHNFFSAVMVADAEVALFLMEPLTDGFDEDKMTEELICTYAEAVKDVPRSNRQFSSAVEQLQYLKSFLNKISKDGGDKLENMKKAKVLAAVAVGLGKL